MIPKRIIMHHSLTKDGETVSWQAIRKYHTDVKGWDDNGYHAGIELVNDHYEILMGRMLNQTGAHCYGKNRDSIGICVVGNFDIDTVPEEQWSLTARFVAGLLVLMDADTDIIHGHNEYSDKSCPGKNFDMDKFKRDVGALI